MTRYATIVADPPWPIGDFPKWFGSGEKGVVKRPYDVMALAEIAALPVADLAADQAHLYLWTITDHLEESFGVARAWGFEPSATIVWCKPPRPKGLGGTFPANVEFVIFATRRIGGGPVVRLTEALADRAAEVGVSRADVDNHMGTSDMGGWWLSRLPHRCACPTNEQWPRLRSLLRLDDPALDGLVAEINAGKGELTATGRASGRWFIWPRGKHSQKPEQFQDLVETVSPGPYLELFARRKRLGWDSWGNEVDSDVDLATAGERC